MAFDIEIATMTCFMEASGEPPEGRRAVVWVFVNRLNSGKYGDTLAAVCLTPWQFSGWNTSDPNRVRMAKTPHDDPILVDCETAVNEALSGEADPTQGALNYYSVTMTTPPDWVATMEFTVQIGNHRFYRPATA